MHISSTSLRKTEVTHHLNLSWGGYEFQLQNASTQITLHHLQTDRANMLFETNYVAMIWTKVHFRYTKLREGHMPRFPLILITGVRLSYTLPSLTTQNRSTFHMLHCVKINSNVQQLIRQCFLGQKSLSLQTRGTSQQWLQSPIHCTSTYLETPMTKAHKTSV